ncbi:hypothetical protein [Sorangium sp. So ce1182]|uniref:hypothetical protein n=1 Tax=Sorangium sp. So ce1182 TaxID=3133334 RepID=UPI003F5DE09B
MTSAGPTLLQPSERLVALGSLAVRPVAYGGENGAGPLPPPSEPIDGLLVSAAEARRPALLRATTNVYGFVDLAPGLQRVLVVDPRGRFLPRAIAVDVPDRRPLADALARGAATLPAVADPPLALAWLRPAPGKQRSSGVHGVVRGPSGAPLALAWIRVDTPEGRFVTYSDHRGEYVAPLPFVRRPAADDADVQINVRVHRLLAEVPASADALEVFPASFDGLAPEIAGFDAVYEQAALVNKAVQFEVGKPVRLDLQPA